MSYNNNIDMSFDAVVVDCKIYIHWRDLVQVWRKAD